MNRRIGPAIRRYRAQLDLPPLVQPVINWMQSPQVVIGLWPDWFAGLQIDHPPELRLVGFPLPDPGETPPLPAALEAFLAAGPPPLVFSHTSAYAGAGDFYREGIKLTVKLGARGVLLASAGVSLPDPLPENVVRFGSVPHVRLYPRAALAVHHGGVGTAAAAFAAGVPQLIVPAIADHPEVARRAKAIGVADSIEPRQFRADRVAQRAQALLDSATIHARCAEVQEKCQSMHAYAEATRLLEDLAWRHDVAHARPLTG
jgi:UDP:flavonoid glycosyltransferase YjiC (YdhE family)